MNVWGSGGAHRTYFKKLDEVVVELFDRPIHQQPRGICDMGSGDGTLLAHLYAVVQQRTARGGMLDEHPLTVVGADFNRIARRATKQTLHAAGIPVSHVIHGDINRPAQLASDLEALGLDVHDLLHIRSFLDHNRPYTRLANYASGSRTPVRPARSRIWGRRFRPTSSRRISSGISAGGPLTLAGSGCSSWSCTRCRRR